MKKQALIITLVFLTSGLCSAQTFDTAWGNRIQSMLDSIVAANNYKGASVAVYAPGEGLWKGASGISGVGIPATTEMCFGIGSNTKLFVAAVLLKLQEQGLLSLDDPLSQWLPPIPNVNSTTTVRQLLSHQSGISNVDGDVWSDTSHVFTFQELLVNVPPPQFMPGHGYFYSGTNYYLAAMVIEAVTGVSWIQKLHDIIFDPLNLSHTFVGGFESPTGPVAHEWIQNVEYPNSPITSEFTIYSSGGGILSTAEEMAMWYSSLFGGMILSPASMSQLLDLEPSSYYGLGIWQFYFYSDNLIFDAYGHGGVTMGYRSGFWYDVQKKICFILLVNRQVTDLNFSGLFNSLLKIIYFKAPKIPIDAGINRVMGNPPFSCDTTFVPQTVLFNPGSDPLTSVDITTVLDNGSTSVFHWTGSIGSGSNETVDLPDINTAAGIHTLKCYCTNPNGVADIYNTNDTASMQFVILDSSEFSAPFVESFEGSEFPPPGWSVSMTYRYPWARTKLSAASGIACAVRPNLQDNKPLSYDLYSPVIDISGITEPVLSFKYAYALFPGKADRLYVDVSNDFGVTFQTLFDKSGSELATAPPTYSNFYPDSSHWANINITLAGFTGKIMLRFQLKNAGGQNIYLDEVSIDQSNGIQDLVTNKTKIRIFPNPADDFVNVTGIKVGTEIRITDFTGRLLQIQTCIDEKMIIDLKSLQPGLYIISAGDQSKKIIKL